MKKFKVFPIIIFFFMIGSFSIWGIAAPDKTYSASENRMLQTFPKISKKRILKGKFQKKYEIYLSDQFPARDYWIQVKSVAERVMGKTESNQVYFGKNQYLLEKYTKEDFNKKQIKKNIEALKKFVEEITVPRNNSNVKIMMVPSKTNILKEKLPIFAENYDEIVFYEAMEKELPKETLIPVKEILEEHKEEYIYYRTDHHWTMLGAWYGYKSYLSACYELEENVKEPLEDKIKEAERKKQELKMVSNDFLGTTYSKVNMYSKKDEIFVYEPKGEFSVIYNLGEKTEDSFYQWEFLKKKDQYSVFSGGNQGILEIMGGEKNGKTLMIVKDSFANTMIPFLMEDYEKIVVVDMRQMNAKLSMVVGMFHPSDVLIVYNLVQFLQDRDFAIKL